MAKVGFNPRVLPHMRRGVFISKCISDLGMERYVPDRKVEQDRREYLKSLRYVVAVTPPELHSFPVATVLELSSKKVWRFGEYAKCWDVLKSLIVVEAERKLAKVSGVK